MIFDLENMSPSQDFDHVLIKVRGGLQRRVEKRRQVRRGLTVGAGLVGVLGAVFLFASYDDTAGKPLVFEGGKHVPSSHVFATGEPTVLSDGSTVSTGPESQLRLTMNTPETFRTELDRGRADFDVVPDKKRARQWVVVAGQVRVRVLGTQFRVARDPHAVTVNVFRGRVEVQGENVRGGRQVLRRGDRLTVDLSNDGRLETDNTTPEPPSRVAPAPESVPEPEGISEKPSATTANVLAQSDALRARGRYTEAAALLSEALAGNSAPSDRAHMAFTLGRIQLDHLGRPAAAARTFSQALRGGLPPALREQAVARAVQAWAMAGREERALQFGRRYLENYPNGPNRDTVLRWLEHSAER